MPLVGGRDRVEPVGHGGRVSPWIDPGSGIIYYDRDECKTRARETLAIMKAAVPLCRDEMFPNYRDAEALCQKMIASFEMWPDSTFAQPVIKYFKAGDERTGMQLSHERVYHYIPEECKWTYCDGN